MSFRCRVSSSEFTVSEPRRHLSDRFHDIGKHDEHHLSTIVREEVLF